MTEVTRILSQIESGDPTGAEQLLPLVYDELRKLAAHKMVQEKPGQRNIDPHKLSYALTHTSTEMARYDQAEPLLREHLKARRENLSDDHPDVRSTLATLGINLLRQNKFAEAETVVRECLALREKWDPDEWTTFNTRSVLGSALVEQSKYAEAEPLLLQVYEGMKQREARIPPQGKVRLTEALERLVQLYDALNQKDKADEWRKIFEEMKETMQAIDKK